MNIKDLFNKDKDKDDGEAILIPKLSAICSECFWPMDVFFIKKHKTLLYVCDKGHRSEELTEVDWTRG